LRVLNSLRLEEKEEVLSEEIKQMEEEIDMREYYEIKRPTVVFFEGDQEGVKAKRYDVISE